MKGSSLDIVTLVEAFFTTILIVSSGAIMADAFTGEVKEKMVDVQAERVKNAVIAISQSPNGSIGIDMEGYKISYDDSETELAVSYQTSHGNVSLDPQEYNFECSSIPAEPTEVNGNLCVERRPDSSCSSSSVPNFLNPSSNTPYRLILDPEGCR